jgi:hypothetical protein
MSLSCRYLLKHKGLCCLIQLVYILLNHHLIKGLCQHMYAGYLNPEKSGRTIRTWCLPDFVLVRAYSIGNGQPCLHACPRIYLFQQAKWNVPSQYTCIKLTKRCQLPSPHIYFWFDLYFLIQKNKILASPREWHNLKFDQIYMKIITPSILNYTPSVQENLQLRVVCQIKLFTFDQIFSE